MLRTLTLAAAAAVALTGAASAQNYPWKPEKPITIIVPWAAGGSTDQVSARGRRRDREGAQPEGRRRQPARRVRLDRHQATCCRPPKDGYTWASGAAKDLGTYAVTGMLDTKIADWRLYLHVVNVSVLCGQPQLALQDPAGTRRRHEGEAGPGLGRHRRRQLVRPYRDRGVHQGAGRHLQARDL